MNFAEGIKRVYVALVCLILLVFSIAQFNSRPTLERTAWLPYEAFRDTIAEAEGKNKYSLNWGQQSEFEFVEEKCKLPLKYTLEKLNTTCQKYIDAKNGLPKELAHHVAESLFYAALTAAGSYFLWVLLAWIGRGFMTKRV